MFHIVAHAILPTAFNVPLGCRDRHAELHSHKWRLTQNPDFVGKTASMDTVP